MGRHHHNRHEVLQPHKPEWNCSFSGLHKVDENFPADHLVFFSFFSLHSSSSNNNSSTDLSFTELAHQVFQESKRWSLNEVVDTLRLHCTPKHGSTAASLTVYTLFPPGCSVVAQGSWGTLEKTNSARHSWFGSDWIKASRQSGLSCERGADGLRAATAVNLSSLVPPRPQSFSFFHRVILSLRRSPRSLALTFWSKSS